MKILTLAILMLALSVQAEPLKKEGIMETARAECAQLAEKATGIQAIRGDAEYWEDAGIDPAQYWPESGEKYHNPALQHIIGAHASEIQEAAGPKFLPHIILRQVEAVGKWVFHGYDAGFDPLLVGQTYNLECQKKTFKRIFEIWPKLKEGPRQAWEQPEELHF